MCRMSCTRSRPGDERNWCQECRDDHERWLNNNAELAVLNTANRVFDSIVPATETEWHRHLDDMAPTVVDLAECPTDDDAPVLIPMNDPIVVGNPEGWSLSSLFGAMLGRRAPSCRS